MGMTNAQTNSERAHDEAHSRGSTIDAFFAGTVILLTGATGFLGKALLEKLLRSCPVAAIFVLIRPKRNKSIEQRFEELLNDPVFDRIRSEFPGTLNKVFPVKGDVGMPELGLQPADRDMLLQSVNIVFHSAATVRFNEPLKIAVNLNTMGTDRMLDLCRRMTNLISVIHVSTAYSNADRREIEESIYITEVKPHTVVDMCENLDDETLGIIEKRLIGDHPNTYTLTKGLAEQIVMTKGRGLPIAIVRPSIVCAANQEPFPGWIDNACGITGIMTEISRGTVRSIVCDANLIVDIVPVDFVVNTLICASWHNFVQRTDTIKIYNCTSSTVHPITWGEFGYLVRKHAIEAPSKYVMWYPGFTFRTNKFIHTIISATLHFLPAFIVDLILRVQGCEPIMLKLTKRFERAAKTGEFFATNEWKFYTDNMTKLVKFVSTQESCKSFDMNIKNMDWDMYLHQYMLGIRKYILKDSLDSLNNARRRLAKLYWMHECTKILSIGFALLGMIKCAGR
ncbi:putative fatty acyl-CoA reductase CG5065 isoform X2 [Solenopsis invicta]|nr:putative fatty acyl-CoA reductase CG5065 isoform X2 [Solenopsis invicta]XP_011166603.1 putative fatty acyl-CoA reductase CG5065 isoform X2 [Solenopsis invicta]XP_011166604.1 putative fatty acyl-CoA reductase CG5065 isoform X2 [Solenopsis invicta]